MKRQTLMLAQLLPTRLEDRFRGYLDFVTERLIDIALEEGIPRSRVDNVRAEFEMIFFVRLLYGYFVHSFGNYQQALNYFGYRHISGFQVGSTIYSRQSLSTSDWEIVVHVLEQIVEEFHLGPYVDSHLSVDQIIKLLLGIQG